MDSVELKKEPPASDEERIQAALAFFKKEGNLPAPLSEKKEKKPPSPPIGQSFFAAFASLRWKKLLVWSLSIISGLLALAALVFLLGHEIIIKHWPEMQRAYILVGLASEPTADRLILKDIHSERRYMDGAMHLVVNGEVLSQAQKTQVVPTILVEALGPDGQLIQSWHIKPPKATLPAGKSLPFASAIISPEGTVTEVNLSFIEQPHDEP